MDLRQDALAIGLSAIGAVAPETAVQRHLRGRSYPGRIVVVSIGKAAWAMAKATQGVLGEAIDRGIVITKDGHSRGPIEGLVVREASHPIPDERAIAATTEALEMVQGLEPNDTVLFLVSGGGSALFEKPLPGIGLADLKAVTDRLLRAGADIVTINAIRKRLSAVKGGRFALEAGPARVETLALSDVLGDRLDSIASGPAYPDQTTTEDVLEALRRFDLELSPVLAEALRTETPKQLPNIESHVIGSVSVLCEAARAEADRRGYTPLVLTTFLEGEAREAGVFVAAIAKQIHANGRPVAPPCAVILGGETVVHVTGHGRGGRNQEMALSAAIALEGLTGTVFLAVGSDGSDGPTDAAGGVVDGTTTQRIRASGHNPRALLENNDSYSALESAGDLVRTGPTGTNVNDLAVLLIR